MNFNSLGPSDLYVLSKVSLMKGKLDCIFLARFLFYLFHNLILHFQGPFFFKSSDNIMLLAMNTAIG